MKKLITILAALITTAQLNGQIFHKKYAFSGEIMQGQTSVMNNNRIYNVSSSTMFQGAFSVQKTDLAGNHIITQTVIFGTSTPVVAVKKVITSGGKLYIVGSIKPGSITDAFLVVLDTNLTTVNYARSYGTTSGNEEFYDILQASNSDLVMVGHSTVPTATISVTKNVPFVVRAAVATGTLIYQKIFEDTYSKMCYSVVEDAPNNSLFISGTVLSGNLTHVLKLTDDNLGTLITAKNVFFSSSNMVVKKMQVYGSKLFLIGGDASNNLMTMETDLTVSALVLPKYYTNFKYYDMIKVNQTNYIAGLTLPTGTVSYMASIMMDSLFVPQLSMTYSLVPVPLGTMWNGVNVLNKSNTMYWITSEGWTAPSPYTNRYIVASDMVMNATCNNAYSLTPSNMVNTMALATYTTPFGSPFTATYSPFPNALTPTITTLCSPTGIENVNEHFEKFVVKNGLDKIIIESPYSDYTINVFDMSGKLILNTKANSETEEITISGFAGGIYIVKLNAKGYEQRQKFIKQ